MMDVWSGKMTFPEQCDLALPLMQRVVGHMDHLHGLCIGGNEEQVARALARLEMARHLLVLVEVDGTSPPLRAAAPP